MAQIAILLVSAAISAGEAAAAAAIANSLRKKPGMNPLGDLNVSSSADGAPILFGYGLGRVPGQIIWSPGLTYYVEALGAQGGGPSENVYFCSFAAAFGEGTAVVKRIWADSKLIYLAAGVSAAMAQIGAYTTWNSSTSYIAGDLVQWTDLVEGFTHIFEAIYPSIGIDPSHGLYWRIATEYPAWDGSVQYQVGSVVAYDSSPGVGSLYAAIVNPAVGAHPADHPTEWVPFAQYFSVPVIYPGNETQNPDPTIQAAEGVANTPAYRGLCYAVWNVLGVSTFGNRLPNIRAELEFTRVPNIL